MLLEISRFRNTDEAISLIARDTAEDAEAPREVN